LLGVVVNNQRPATGLDPGIMLDPFGIRGTRQGTYRLPRGWFSKTYILSYMNLRSLNVASGNRSREKFITLH
jgi:hypothetical protein